MTVFLLLLLTFHFHVVTSFVTMIPPFWVPQTQFWHFMTFFLVQKKQKKNIQTPQTTTFAMFFRAPCCKCRPLRPQRLATFAAMMG